jgi:HTH-type transcriptional regulator/antitoxin HigA
MLDRLATASEGSLSRGEQDYLDTLTLLVEDYDRRHRPVENEPDAIMVLKHLMEANDMTVSDLGDLLGSKGNASEVLSGKRSLSKSHMAKLAARFGLDVSLFFPRPPMSMPIDPAMPAAGTRKQVRRGRKPLSTIIAQIKPRSYRRRTLEMREDGNHPAP